MAVSAVGTGAKGIAIHQNNLAICSPFGLLINLIAMKRGGKLIEHPQSKLRGIKTRR
jgi:hypothetical protein